MENGFLFGYHKGKVKSITIEYSLPLAYLVDLVDELHELGFKLNNISETDSDSLTKSPTNKLYENVTRQDIPKLLQSLHKTYKE